jgi:iron complex transport system ATP-binding protein
MTRLQADALTIGYGGPAVVQDLSAHFADGRVTSIIGPNGCGKSTLLRALARLLKPRGGAAILDGESIQRQPTKDVARRLGLLPQGAVPPEAITVEDLVRRGRFPHQSLFSTPTDSDRLAVERALERANVQDLRTRPVDELSGGQRQRAWIAMALAQETPLLLLDEPTTYLDVAHQQEVLELVRDLNREGKTIVMVLHDVNEAARASDHIIAMRDGVIVAEGAPGDVVTPERLLDVFGVRTDVVAHPRSQLPVCIPRGPSEGCAVVPLPDARLRAEGLTVGYDRRVVATDLSVDFPHGAVTAIIGPNACGKSTLLRCLARLLQPQGGRVLLDGASIHRASRGALARRMGMLTQAPQAPPDVTVEELVAAGRFPYQRWYAQWSDQDERAVAEALEATGMAASRHARVDSLSGGQRQRVWIAMSLAQHAEIMLLDEPTTFLDIAHQVEVLDLVRRLNRDQGRTVVMVLHDLVQACRYADFLIAMRDGEILARGRPVDIVTPDLIRAVFDVEADVLQDEQSGAPLVLLADVRRPSDPGHDQDEVALAMR